ncbi:MAG: hypothetical protein RLZZ04_1853 [Cyanobacteriota bacterium]|jgi:hypothetical protein
MIIDNLPCLEVLADHDEVMGGKQIKFCSFDFKNFWGKKLQVEAYAFADGTAEAYAFADGKNVWASYGTSICLDGDVSETHSYAKSSSQS